jgi:hypothetical protein
VPESATIKKQARRMIKPNPFQQSWPCCSAGLRCTVWLSTDRSVTRNGASFEICGILLRALVRATYICAPKLIVFN